MGIINSETLLLVCNVRFPDHPLQLGMVEDPGQPFAAGRIVGLRGLRV